jgi:hypothetical protein
MPDTRLDDLRERHRYVEGHNADGDERSGCICGELWQCDAADALAHLDALTAAAREFFGGGRWQYHDEYAHVLLVDLDRLHDALLPDEEPHDA